MPNGWKAQIMCDKIQKEMPIFFEIFKNVLKIFNFISLAI